MSKKVLIIGGVLLVILAGVGGGYFLFSRRTQGSEAPPQQENLQVVSGNVKADLTYSDDSGFSFGYPTGVKVTDTTPNDDAYYTKLNLSKNGDAKVIEISVKDTQASSVEGFVKSEWGLTSSDLVGASALGGISAKQYEANGKQFVVALDQGVIYIIQGPKESGFWGDTQNVVVTSFAFAGSKPVSNSGGNDTIYESEDVVE